MTDTPSPRYLNSWIFILAMVGAFLSGLTAGYWSADPGTITISDQKSWEDGYLAGLAHAGSSLMDPKALDAALGVAKKAAASPDNREAHPVVVTPRIPDMSPEDLAYYRMLHDRGYYPMVILVPRKDVP